MYTLIDHGQVKLDGDARNYSNYFQALKCLHSDEKGEITAALMAGSKLKNVCELFTSDLPTSIVSDDTVTDIKAIMVMCETGDVYDSDLVLVTCDPIGKTVKVDKITMVPNTSGHPTEFTSNLTCEDCWVITKILTSVPLYRTIEELKERVGE